MSQKRLNEFCVKLWIYTFHRKKWSALIIQGLFKTMTPCCRLWAEQLKSLTYDVICYVSAPMYMSQKCSYFETV